jgi:hypothetical protein
MLPLILISAPDPYISAKDLYAWFGLSSSTGQGKSKQVRDVLKISQMDPDWCLPSMMDQNPLAWMISVNGMLLDTRSVPHAVQEQLSESSAICRFWLTADGSGFASFAKDTYNPQRMCTGGGLV